MKTNPTSSAIRWCVAFALMALSSLTTLAANLTWDGIPATPGPQDANGSWGTSASNTNWWDGANNVTWNNANGDTAVFGVSNSTAITVTLTNPVVVGGIIYSNVATNSTATYTVGISSTTSLPIAAATNITLTGASPTILVADHNSIFAAQAVDAIQPSVIVTGAVSIVASTASTNSFFRFANITNNFAGGQLYVGTPGNTTYGGTTALICDINTPTAADVYTSCANNLTNVTIYTNATFRISGHNSAPAGLVQWPKQITISGDGRNGFGGAWLVTGNAGDNFAANVVVSGDSTIEVNAGTSGQTYGLYGVIAGTGRLQFVADNAATSLATVILTNANTWNGNLLVAGGVTLLLTNGNDRVPTTAALTLGRNDGANPFWNRFGKLTLGNSSTAVNQTLAGLTTGNSGCVVAGGNSTNSSILTVNNANDNIYAGMLGGSAAPANKIALVKGGAGNLFLEGTNLCSSYTVNNGTLQIGDGTTDYIFGGTITNNAAVVFNVASALTDPSVITGGGMVTKQGFGTLTLSANNNFNALTVSAGVVSCTVTQAFSGPVNLASGAELDLKRPLATSYSTAVSLNLNSDVLKFDFNGMGIAPAAPLQVSGALTNAGTLSIFINSANAGSIGVGSYPLIKYGSFVDAGSSFFALGTPINAQISAYISNNVANKSIDLVVTASDYLQWTGATDTNWDTTTTNWMLHSSSAPTLYADGGAVTFNDSGNNTAINLVQGFSPATITVTNSAKNYSFNGTAFGVGFSGSTTIIKQGPGTLMLANGNNSYSGGTTISGGTLIIGNGSVDTTVSSPIQDDAALVLNVASGITPPVINGAGSVTVTNAGTLILNNANTYTGPTTIYGGIVQMNNSAAFGATNAGTVLSPGTELDINANITTAEALTLGGSGVSGGGALVVEAGTGASAWNGPITATANTIMVAPGNTSLTFGGVVNGGNNILTFQPADTAFFTVSSNLSAGTVQLDAAGGLVLDAANDTVTNVVVDKASPTSGSVSPTAGIFAFDSHALGTNGSVRIINTNLIGNSGAILRLGNSVNIPATVTMNISLPGTGDAGPGMYRATFGTLGATTNTWNGPITVHGATPGSTPTQLFIRPDTGSEMILNGNITLADGDATFFPRGAGQVLINGQVNWGTNLFSITSDGVVDVTVASTGNIWRELDIVGQNATMHVGANNALPINAPVFIGNSLAQFDLNGFNQQIGGLRSSAIGAVFNGSTNTPSTLTVYSTAGSNWLYTGAITYATGAQPLNLNVSGDTLTLTYAVNDYAGSTTVRAGATLALTGGGNISASTPMDIQAGGVFDVSGNTAATFTLTAGRTLMGKGTVNGSISAASSSLLAPGESVGTLTITTNLTVAGNLLFAVDKSLSPAASNSVLSVGGVLTNSGTGTVTITNLNSAHPFVAGDKFTLFSQPLLNGSAMTISPATPGAGLGWTNNLAVDGSIGVVQSVALNPTNITFSVSGSTLTLSWPADHLGWHLQMQTNGLGVGLKTNGWVTIPGTDQMTSTNISITKTNPTAFYRLTYP
jgi:autotransporter-associated beta strand protein